ncbi:hypothetical protein N787_14070 [Arenimonas metalli CF5-1]|uniref:Uncharacterized protein n=1 Tax=Arenimonas metalli CF5-1 TaxID=1384056 RepID=A0A091AUD7_9GAMM|nr:hypothetical protein N787_14070 [Arenimonas metalli CF5-1]
MPKSPHAQETASMGEGLALLEGAGLSGSL